MARRRGWILFVLGLMFALIAGVLSFFLLEQYRTAARDQAKEEFAQEQLQNQPTMQLPIAVRKLDPGTVLTVNDYVLKDFPVDLVPVEAVTQTQTLENKVLARAVGQGETFHSSQFLGSDGASISQQIAKGQILMAFPIVDLLSQTNLINDGDRLDLLLTLKEGVLGEEPQSTGVKQRTGITLQNVSVFRVQRSRSTDEQEKGAATALLFSLKPEDAVMLKFIKDLGGTIDFTLRSPLDKDVTFEIAPVNEDDLRSRFKFR